MLLKSFVRTGTLLAGARAFAPLAVQRRAFTKMSAAPIGVMVTVEIEEARVRSRRPVVWMRLHFMETRRLQERMSWLVSFWILRPFGPSRETTMLRAGVPGDGKTHEGRARFEARENGQRHRARGLPHHGAARGERLEEAFA